MSFHVCLSSQLNLFEIVTDANCIFQHLYIPTKEYVQKGSQLQVVRDLGIKVYVRGVGEGKEKGLVRVWEREGSLK